MCGTERSCMSYKTFLLWFPMVFWPLFCHGFATVLSLFANGFAMVLSQFCVGSAGGTRGSGEICQKLDFGSTLTPCGFLMKMIDQISTFWAHPAPPLQAPQNRSDNEIMPYRIMLFFNLSWAMHRCKKIREPMFGQTNSRWDGQTLAAPLGLLSHDRGVYPRNTCICL